MPERGSTNRNLRMAILLALVAVGFYVGFFFEISHRAH